MTDGSIAVAYVMGALFSASAFTIGASVLWLVPAFRDALGPLYPFYQGALAMSAVLSLPLGAFYVYARVQVMEADTA